MNDICELLDKHLTKYPLMELTDMVKLLYQNEFGPGHMITNEAESLRRLEEEWERTSHSSSLPLYDSIGNGLARINLSALQRRELPILNALFCQTANHMQGDRAKFTANLNCLASYSRDAADFLSDYEKKGYPPLSHSEAYRQAYHPAYRVVLESHISFLELIRTLHLLLSKQSSVTVAIDGCCASGKTTLSSLLETCFDCNIIHMDDFFLPPDLRTPERLASPGGNVHYERFAKEVMSPLKHHEPITYRRFSCRNMDYADTVSLRSKPLTIVEGSYCMRPEFRSSYDYTVFLSCSYEQQTARIHKRNGEAMLQNFILRWIPMENAYFNTFHVAENCNKIILT